MCNYNVMSLIKLVFSLLLSCLYLFVFFGQFVIKMTLKGDILRILHSQGINPGSEKYANKLSTAILDHFGILAKNLTAGSERKLSDLTKKMASESGKMFKKANNFEKMFSYYKNKVRYNLDFKLQKLKNKKNTK